MNSSLYIEALILPALVFTNSLAEISPQGVPNRTGSMYL